MRRIIELGIEFVENGLYHYAVLIMFSYVILGVISVFSLKAYKRRSKHTKYQDLLPSALSPTVSLIAPAYNEELNIVENIKSMVSLHYSNYEVVIINDGSKDNTLSYALEAFKMEPVSYEKDNSLESKPIRNVYRSTLPTYGNIILIDKENGGKADALNAGISLASGKYVACIDVDCILEQDALLKLVKPFLDSEKRVIATGGVIRIINSCEIENGVITNVTVPKSWIARMQVLEYLRAFLMGRIAWGRVNGLMLISGAFGMFDKEILVKSGGYYVKTVGEDMELVVRMSRYMIENNIPYKVDFIPDPLCWTEAPETTKILGRQRNRWTRGTVETLREHRKVFFNPKYGTLGMISYPYWFFFEYLAPIIECLGIVWIIIAIILGIVNWPFFYIMSVFVYTFVQMVSMFAIFCEEISYHRYKSHKDILLLLGSALLEPFIYHPFLVYSAIRGHIDYYKGVHTWGEMTRKGLKTT
ncbi:MAG: glycosyltransferase family 2 protein [Leadbetterella sp.]